jgi:hypothetical protein
MHDREKDTKSGEQRTRAVQVFVSVGLAIGIALIIAGGWLMKNEDKPSTSAAHLRITPKAPSTTTGSR